jgi:RNA polymerase sigma factor (sigma-70 family)
MNATDQECLERFVTQQDQAAFEELVRKHGPMVLGLCQRILRDSHEAQDVFQAVFLILAKKAGSIRKQQSLGSWLYRVASNAALNVKRSAGARVRTFEPLEETMTSDLNQEEQRQWAEIRPAIDEELGKLPEKHRAPLVLCYFEGMTYEEAAEELGITHKALKNRLERTRELLRDRFARRGLVLSSAAFATLLSQSASASISNEAIHAAAGSAILMTAKSTGMEAAISPKILQLMRSYLRTVLYQKLVIASIGALLVLGAVIGTVASLPEAEEEEQFTYEAELRIQLSPQDGLSYAAATGNLSEVQKLLAQGTFIDTPPSNNALTGWTPMMFAIARDQFAVTKFLLERGASPNVKVNLTCKGGKHLSGFTPLVFASASGNKRMVDLLLKHGADANAQTTEGLSALMCAGAKNHLDVVKALLAAGADVKAKMGLPSSKQVTAIEVAQRNDNEEIVELLQKASAEAKR